MSTAQSGITAEASSNAYFLCLNIRDAAAARYLLQHFSRQLNNCAQRYPDSRLRGVIAIGSEAWDKVFTGTKPARLMPFPELTNGAINAPHTPCDLFIHLRSERHDINFELARELLQEVDGGLELVEEIHGFRYLDSRDLTGFVDGTENPQGEDRARVALCNESGPLAHGSYIHTQRYVHDLPRWEQLDLEEQEDTIGRTKADNIEYASADKPLTAHIKRANIKNDDGSSVELLRHSMPYGGVDEHGLFFVSYAGDSRNFERILESMIHGDGHHTDHLLNYTRAVTGAAFFAPPIEFLDNPAHYQD